MSPAPLPTVALIGNPNTGKSTLFVALSGVRQQIGNYPGVTVEKKLGQLTHGERSLTLVDLPGTYSLAPRSPDEMVTVEVLLGRQAGAPRPDAVLCIVDASNLERNLYLVSQVLELGQPTVLALNMIDVARQRGLKIEIAELERKLGVPIIPVQGNKRVGLNELKTALIAAVGQTGPTAPELFPEGFQRGVAELQQGTRHGASREELPRYLAQRLLLDSNGFLAGALVAEGWHIDHGAIERLREELRGQGCPVPAVEAMSRYAWISRVLEGIVERPARPPLTWSDRFDRILTHRVWGTLAFLAVMFIVFQSVFQWANPAMEAIDGLTGSLGELLGSRLPEGALRSLIVDGVVSGVGGVIIFLPQIMILFGLIAMLEDCGYLARAAYLMDKLMSRVGLSGKSFIPLLSSFACAIPGIMATRVLENRRDRLTTMLVAPLMSCSARLPVYTLLIGTFVPNTSFAGGWIRLPGLVLMGMYALGVITAVAVAWVLKKTLLRGPTPPFVLELPSFKWPSPWLIVERMVSRGWVFVKNAGTLILAVSIVVWAALYYPHDEERIEGPYRAGRATLTAELESLPEDDPRRVELEEQLADIEHAVAGEYQRASYLGQFGKWIEPAVQPLGWDWRLGCAAIASFPAREVVVATLGILYNLGGELDVSVDEDRQRLGDTLREARWDGTDRPVFTLPVALSIMVFFALCAQCASTLVIMKRETNSWRWPAFTFLYMTTLAYVAAWGTYQLGTWLGG